MSVGAIDINILLCVCARACISRVGAEQPFADSNFRKEYRLCNGALIYGPYDVKFGCFVVAAVIGERKP